MRDRLAQETNCELIGPRSGLVTREGETQEALASEAPALVRQVWPICSRQASGNDVPGPAVNIPG